MLHDDDVSLSFVFCFYYKTGFLFGEESQS